jgi:hypothetical protein
MSPDLLFEATLDAAHATVDLIFSGADAGVAPATDRLSWEALLGAVALTDRARAAHLDSDLKRLQM